MISIITFYFNCNWANANVSTPTNFHSTSSSLIDLVFVNHGYCYITKFSASGFSNHDLFFLNYIMPITSAVGRYIGYRDFRNTDYVSLNTELDDWIAFHKPARADVTRHIKLAKVLYYSRKFSNAMENKSKWNIIREIGIGGKCPKTDFDVDVNKPSDQFVHSRVPTAIGNMYYDLCCVPPQYSFSFRCVDQFKVLECISALKSNAIGSDDFDPLFLEVLTPRLLPFYTHLFNTVLTKSTFPDEWKLAKILPKSFLFCRR